MAVHPVILKSIALRHYLRRDVAQAIAEECENREIAVKFLDRFGKRPERIDTSAEVLDFARSGASSYHTSEELWSDPLAIETGMSEKDAREKRIGWDLIIDVDCPDWGLSKTIAKSLLSALDSYGVRVRSIKFSGNKGFHIGVPTEAFPITIMDSDGTEHRTSDLFPEVPRIMLSLLATRIRESLVAVTDESIELSGDRYSWRFLADLIGVEERDIIIRRCSKCGRTESVNLFRCAICRTEVTEQKDYAVCPEHGADTMQLVGRECSNRSCRSTVFDPPEVDIEAILHLDTQLISNRHMFRAPYSLHEKSGLVSVVFPESALDDFEKEMAKPEYLATPHPFLAQSVRDRAESSHGRALLAEALEAHKEDLSRTPTYSEEIDLPEEAISEEHFPPSIRNILNGVTVNEEPLKDGRKRSVLILINFLRCMGWDQESVEARLYAWNRALEEPLRDVYIKGQLRHAFRSAPMLPPNYDNKDYYTDIGVYDPKDPLEKTLKNPVQYAKRKAEVNDG
jgi:hypothetical protein